MPIQLLACLHALGRHASSVCHVRLLCGCHICYDLSERPAAVRRNTGWAGKWLPHFLTCLLAARTAAGWHPCAL